MLFGYENSGKEFTKYDLSSLGPDEALVIGTAGGKRLQVTAAASSREVFVNNRPCLTEAVVAEWMSVTSFGGQPTRNVSRLVQVGQFWQYDTDLMSHRVESITMHVRSSFFSDSLGGIRLP